MQPDVTTLKHLDGSDFSAAEKAQVIQGRAKAALFKSDMVALRCMKAGVPFPGKWLAFVCECRAILNNPTSVGFLPGAPEYPKGT